MPALTATVCPSWCPGSHRPDDRFHRRVLGAVEAASFDRPDPVLLGVTVCLDDDEDAARVEVYVADGTGLGDGLLLTPQAAARLAGRLLDAAGKAQSQPVGALRRLGRWLSDVSLGRDLHRDCPCHRGRRP